MFTIAVAPEFLRSPQAAMLRRVYFAVVAALGIGAFAACFVAVSQSLASAWPTAAPLLEMAGLFSMWAWAWHQTVPHRLPHAVVRTASLTEKPIGAGWWLSTLTAWLPLIAAAIILQQQWLQIPDQFATHWGLDGRPNGWTDRTAAGVFCPLGLGAGLVLLIAAMGWILARYSAASSTPVIKRMTLNILRLVCWLMGVMFAVTSLLPLLRRPEQDMLWMVAAMVLATLAMVAYAAATVVREQNFEQLQNATNEQAWKFGMFYYNPQDAALFVPKRMGYGFTFNFARPAAWLMIAAFLVLAIAPLVFLHGSHAH
jgi:uncharacterized membrane protein